MALDVILLKTPYSVAFTGNPMPFVFALAPYGDTEKAQVILLQVRVLIEDTYGTSVYTEVHSQNIYPDNNGMVSLDVHTLLDPYLKWFVPKPNMPCGIIKEAPEQRKRYKLSYLLQQNSEVIGQTQETGLFLAIKGGLSYESWKPVDFFNQAEGGQPLHFLVSKNIILPDQLLFFWWLMPDVPQSSCIPVTIENVTLSDGDTSQEYDEYIYVHGSLPVTISNVILPAGLNYTFNGDIHIGGTPTNPEDQALISFTLTNCSGAPLVFEDHIKITGCVALTITPGAFPDAVIGQPYEHFVVYTGNAPTSAVNPDMPSWMNFNIQSTQSRIRFYGTPPAGAEQQHNVLVGFYNCDPTPAYINEFINVTNAGTAVSIDRSQALANATVGQAYSQTLVFTGSDVLLSDFVAPSGLTYTLTMNSGNTGGTVSVHGTPTASGSNQTVSFTLSNSFSEDFYEKAINVIGVSAGNTTVSAATSPRSGIISGSPGQTYTVSMSAGGSGTFSYHLSVDAGGSGTVTNTQNSASFTFVMPNSGQTNWTATYSSSDNSSSGSFSVS